MVLPMNHLPFPSQKGQHPSPAPEHLFHGERIGAMGAEWTVDAGWGEGVCGHARIVLKNVSVVCQNLQKRLSTVFMGFRAKLANLP